MKILKVAEASKQFKRSRNTFYRWIKEGLKTVEDIEPISFYEEEIKAFIKTLRKKGREPKEVNTDDLVKRYEAGETAEKISETVNLSKQAIINRLRKSGVKIRQRGGDFRKK